MNTIELSRAIEQIWDNKNLNSSNVEDITIINTILNYLDNGNLKICDKVNGVWQVNQWAKKAILLSFKLFSNKMINNSFDKIPLKFASWQQEDFVKAGIRVVPGSIVRLGAYIAKNTILMPCFVNIGAFINEGTMIDSGTSIGSCAQIGKRCHISANASIGGVLEPLQHNPVIIEDDCFIGMGSMVAEGIIIEEGAVLSSGVTINGSTKIVDRQTNKIYYGKVPAYSVVVPGTYAINDQISLNCAVIVKTVDTTTRAKTAINELLRENNS